MSTGQAAKRFSVSISAAGAWARLKRATGSVHPAKQGKPKGSVLDALADFILGVMEEETPDTTLDEMAERWVVRGWLTPAINAHEVPHRHAVIEAVLGLRILHVEPLLQKVCLDQIHQGAA